MKTPIQELIEELKANDVAHGMFWIKRPSDFFEKYLEKEKEQIIDAMERTAMYVSVASIDKEIGKMTIEDLYNQTYNQNK